MTRHLVFAGFVAVLFLSVVDAPMRPAAAAGCSLLHLKAHCFKAGKPRADRAQVKRGGRPTAGPYRRL